jgi:hypothetical protein
VLQVTGNIYIYGASSISGVVSANSRLDLRVNNGVYQGVSSRVISGGKAYTDGLNPVNTEGI